jgi:glyoxylase I family protein
MSRGALSHVDFSVGDPHRAISFYDRLLTTLGYRRWRGDDPAWQEPNPTRAAWGIVYPDGGTFGIDLRPATTNADRTYDRYEPGPHHMAFHADSDELVDAVHRAMVAAGAPVLDPPCNYGGQKGYGDYYYAVFFADPDGFKVEVVNTTLSHP